MRRLVFLIRLFFWLVFAVGILKMDGRNERTKEGRLARISAIPGSRTFL